MAFVNSIPPEEEGVMAVMRRYPEQGLPMNQLTEIVMRSGDCEFSSRERELIAAFVSGANDCVFCYNTHKSTAEAFGVAEGLLSVMLDDLDASQVDDKLKPVLRFAKKLTETPSRMLQSDADAIFDAGWSENSFHYTVMICALFNFYNRIMDGYGVTNTADFRPTRGQALAGKGVFWPGGRL